MALYCYIKAGQKRADCRSAVKPNIKKSGFPKLAKKPAVFDKISKVGPKVKLPTQLTSAAPIIFIVLGFSFLLFAGWPILSWGVNFQEKAPEAKLIKPVADNLIGGEVLAEVGDLTKASNWFVGARAQIAEINVKQYIMSIPKLEIEDAKVLVGGEDLTESLIHYAGTAIPGNLGTGVVFGHSVLPQFFNPKDYHAIFATLPEVEVGDEILVKVDDVTYKYVVYGMTTVDPTDLSVLEQHFDNYYLYVITCVPPGLDLKRLVIKAKLEEV